MIFFHVHEREYASLLLGEKFLCISVLCLLLFYYKINIFIKTCQLLLFVHIAVCDFFTAVSSPGELFLKRFVRFRGTLVAVEMRLRCELGDSSFGNVV